MTPRLRGLAATGATATVFAPFRALGWGFASPTRRPPMPERPSGRIGLYDPTYEHDACGVAMVAKLDARAVARDGRARDRRAREPRAPRRRGRRSQHRRRRRNPAPAARRVHPRRHRRGAAAGRRLRRLRVLPPARGGAARRARAAARGHRRATRASASSPGATCRSTRTTSASRPTSTRRTSSSSSWPPPTSSRTDQDAFERKLYVIRRVAEIAAGPELVIPSFSSRTIVYKGMLTSPQLLGYYPDLAGPAHEVRAGARPPPLLHEHVPELGARAPVPDDRPQRRDQHAAREHQLDAGARVAARLRAVRRRPAEGAPGRAPRRQRHARRSTTCSSCSCWPAAASRTR